MASIFIRSGKIWVSLYQHGQRIRKSTKLKNTKENRKKVEKDLIPKLEKSDLSPKNTVGYYYQTMMQDKVLKETSIRKYGHCYSKHIAQFNDRPIDSFKVSELKLWMPSIKTSAKQVKSIVSVFRMIFQEAIYDEAIESNPFKHIKMPKAVRYEPEPFSSEEINTLLENADGWFKNLLALLFMTGMRIGEALALEWSDIDIFICVDKTLSEGTVTETKTYNFRHIPIFEDLKPYLKNQRFITGLKGKRVFTNLRDAKDLHKYWHKLLKKCHIEHRVLYQARHTFAIHALDSGMFKVSQISKILGHSSVQMLFQKYAKYIKSEVEEIPISFSTLGTRKDTKVS